MIKHLLVFGFLVSLSTVDASAQQDTSRYVTINLDIPQLQRKRDVQIFLPADYHTSNKKYPVLYMQDAQNIYNNDVKNKNGTWAVDSLVRSYPVDKQAIIVGINHAGKDRIAEYSPYKSNYAQGEGPAYLEFMVNNLKTYIDSHYRTKPDAIHTGIGGSSMGGLIALYAAVKYPKVFGAAGSFSPALWINPEIEKFVGDADILPRSRFWFACGDLERNESSYVNKMDSILLSKKVLRKNMPQPLILKGEEHNEHQWRLEFPVFYDWWVKGW